MQIEKRFVVQTSTDRVWAFLTDPGRVAQCLPGAAITGQDEDGTYQGTITVKVGPISSSYKGKLRFERLDPAARTAEIVASGQDVRGKGGADLRMTSQLTERSPNETEVVVVQNINVTGILAQMGRGMIQDVGDQLFERFTSAMRGQLESAPVPAAAGGTPTPVPPPPAAEPIQVVSLGAGVAGRAAGRAFRHPVVWLGLIGIAVVVWWLFG